MNEAKFKETIDFLLEKTIKLAKKLDVKVFLVGGFIRDLLLDNKTFDLDFIVFGNSQVFAKEIAAILKASFVVLDDQQKSYRVVKNFEVEEKIVSLDFTQAKGKTLEEDLKTRDFTINSFAIELTDEQNSIFEGFEQKIIDKLNAFSDLKNQTIRAISVNIFDDDPLRLLRAFRIAAKYKFHIDKSTLVLIEKKTGLIKNSAGERIREELVKFFSYDDIFEFVLAMDETELFSQIFPQANLMKREQENYYHKKGLWGHSLEVLFCFEFILKNLEKLFDSKIASFFRDYLEQENNVGLLKIACLFHDVGKPETLKIEGEKIHFINHDEISSRHTNKMLKDLKFGNKETDKTKNFAKFHMYFGNLAREKEITDRAYFRFFKKTEDEAVGLLFFTLADWLASIRGARLKTYKGGITFEDFEYSDFKICKFQVEKILAWHFKSLENKKPKLLINGNDVMQKFELHPSPLIGKLLDLVEENQAVGEISNTEEAFDLLEKYLRSLE